MEVREAQVARIDAAHRAFAAARASGDEQAVRRADAVLNNVVLRNSSPGEIEAWAAMKEREAGRA